MSEALPRFLVEPLGDHHERGRAALHRHDIATANLALDLEAELLEEPFDGGVEAGFQGTAFRS